MAMMAITTNNSISVNPRRGRKQVWFTSYLEIRK